MSKIKKILCVIFGHPPVVTTCLGYVHCARCEDQVGDTLGGSTSLKMKAVVGHDCEVCRSIWRSLSFTQKLLTRRI